MDATVVANGFIDEYMAAASGEYVKVYLYLLRHQEREVEPAEVADALNHTEADIKRAMAYWVRQGVLIQEEPYKEENEPVDGRRTSEHVADGLEEGVTVRKTAARATVSVGRSSVRRQEGLEPYGTDRQRRPPEEIVVQEEAEDPVLVPTSKEIKSDRPYYTPEQVGRLAKEEDFTQLLYISQKYMNKVFTPRECEVFAYLYDALHMPAELLEYVVEYCVQGGHYSIRDLETVALDWHQRGIRTVDMAKQYTASFSDEAFSVMKAFGLNERRPGDAEMEMIRRWFKEWGFTKELVLEACKRTLRATHNPSFAYTDKILSEWKKARVKGMEDVKRLDEIRGSAKPAKPGKTGAAVTKPAKNQFHNFEQRDTDYDEVVLERLKQRLETERE